MNAQSLNKKPPTIKKWFVWTPLEHHFTQTYEEAWRLSEALFASTGRTAVIEPVYSL